MHSQLKESFAVNDFKLKKYTEASIEWNEVVNSCSSNKCYFDVDSIKYYVDYFSRNIGFESISSVVFHNSKPAAVIILELERNEKGKYLTSNGGHVIQPIYIKGLPKKVVKKINSSLHLFIDVLKEASFNFNFAYEITESGCSDWYCSLINKYKLKELEHNLYVDLTGSLDSIKLNFRKSFRPLINKVTDLSDVRVIDSMSDQIEKTFREFKDLHIHVSGRKTRNDSSWDIQCSMVKNDRAFLICLYDNENLVGAGFFQKNNASSVYAVGVYDRDRFTQPLGHIVQYKAIEYMKKIGLQRYELGMRYYSAQQKGATEKEISISHFKEGFANLILPTVVFK